MIYEMQKDDLLPVKTLMQSITNFWHKVWDCSVLERAFSASGALHYVYKLEDEIVGCIFAYNLGFRGYIAELAVLEKMQNKGIGRKLVEHVEILLKEGGCELVIVDAFNTAVPFYKKLGWDYPNAVLLRKRLID